MVTETMARPRLPIRTHGVISTQQLAPGKHRARTLYRFDDGTLRQVERVGPTKVAAIMALKAALVDITAGQGVEVKRATRLRDLAERFMESKTHLAPRSVDTYQQTINHHINPKLGDLAVSEATAERLQRFVEGVARDSGPGAAKACKAVLSGMLGLAARSDAVRSNPVRDLAPIATKAGHKGAEAFPLADFPRLLAAVRGDERLRELDQADLIEFLAGTGCRVGEVCALQWKDVDLAASTVTISANVVRAKGRGLIRQDHPKTTAGVRTIALPKPLVGLLGDRRIRLGDSPLVFPTVLGNLRDPRNTMRDWRDARIRLGFANVSTHSFRKTVATALDQAGLSAREVAEYLGHENPSITQDVYMAKNTGGIRAAAALDELLV